MEKTLDYLYAMKKANEDMGSEAINIIEAIKELEDLQEEYKYIKEYYWFARNHLDTYRCKCGALGKVGYRCSNRDCKFGGLTK